MRSSFFLFRSLFREVKNFLQFIRTARGEIEVVFEYAITIALLKITAYSITPCARAIFTTFGIGLIFDFAR